MVTAPFIKLILVGKKKLLKMSEVRFINPPRFDEISVVNLYDRCIKWEGMIDYFPDHYPKGRNCNRGYFFNVLATLHPEDTANMIIRAKKVRVMKEEDGIQGDSILISPEWEEELKEFPQVASKLSLIFFNSFTPLF